MEHKQHLKEKYSLYGLAKHHHNSFKIQGIYYVRSWISSVRNSIEIGAIRKRKDDFIYVYLATWWANPKNGPPVVNLNS